MAARKPSPLGEGGTRSVTDEVSGQRPLHIHRRGGTPGRPPGLGIGMRDVYRAGLLEEAAQSSTSPVRSPSDTPVMRTFTKVPAGTTPAAVKYTWPSISTESA